MAYRGFDHCHSGHHRPSDHDHNRHSGHGHHHNNGHHNGDGDSAFPPDATIAGLSMDDWTGRWWTSVLQSDIEHNIVIGADPGDAQLGDVGKVHMLGGLFAPADETGDHGSITRSFHVDHGDAILVPVLNIVDIEGPAFGTAPGTDPVARLNEIIGNWTTSIDWDDTHLFVDGQELDLAPHLHRTSVFSMGEVRSGTVASDSLGAPVGEAMDLSMAAGIMVMLEPLSKGEHDIAWEGTTHALPGRDGTFEFHYEVHDTVTVW